MEQAVEAKAHAPNKALKRPRGLGFRVWGSGFWVWGLRFRMLGFGFRVWGYLEVVTARIAHFESYEGYFRGLIRL